MPRSARGWLRWAAFILEAQARPHCSRPDWGPRTDFRIRDSRETALSIKRMVERVDDGAGAGELLFRFYVDDVSWWSFRTAPGGIPPRGGGRIGRSIRAPRRRRCSLSGVIGH